MMEIPWVNWATNLKEFHEKILYPLTLVRTAKSGGSGTVIFSKPHPDGEGFLTYVLTNHHVIDEAISFSTDYDPLVGRDVKKPVYDVVSVGFYSYRHLSKQASVVGYQADIVHWDKSRDLALLELRDRKQAEYVAAMFPEKGKHLYIGQPVVAVGCSLGHKPLPSIGMISSLDEQIENQPRLLSSAQIIYGNCLPGDVPVMTNPHGQVAIADLRPGDRVACLKGDRMGFSEVRRVIQSGIKPMYRVCTSMRSVEASSDHPFLAAAKTVTGRDKNGKAIRNDWRLEWLPLRKLKVGQPIAVAAGLPDEGKPYVLPDGRQTTEEFTRLVGCFLGDGYVRLRPGQGGELVLCLFELEKQRRYSHILAEWFGKRAAADSRGMHLYSVEAARLFDTLGLNYPSTEKHIPAWVWGLPHTQKKALIEGYCDADGYRRHLKSTEMRFEANNRRLIEEMALCISIGYRVGNLHSRMKRACSRNQRGQLITPTTASWSFFASPDSQKSNRHLLGCYGLERLDIPEGLMLDRIRSIEPMGKKPSFDIEVAEAHNFVADGVLVHNSGGALFTLDEKELIGVPCAGDVIIMGFSAQAITHLGYSIPWFVLYDFLRDGCFDFIFDETRTYDECEKRRKEKMDELQRAWEERFKREKALARE